MGGTFDSATSVIFYPLQSADLLCKENISELQRVTRVMDLLCKEKISIGKQKLTYSQMMR